MGKIMIRALDVIIKKRNGNILSDLEIQFLISEFTNGNIPDYQMAAFAMAVFFKSMSGEELSAFTKSMLHSGSTIDLASIAGVAVDKHSTGGVGDKISIPLAPAVAACGVLVPMISGRGLGHTGGTLDKLESIPGFSCNLTVSKFKKQLSAIGCCFGGQTDEIAPADKKLYALRDVTGTIECIPLIASSIMSKKLAEGIKGLVLDVKYGSGAFMRDPKDAYLLAQTMVDIGTRMGTETVARLTCMEQPIGIMAGNSLEICESIDVLKGMGPKDTNKLVIELGAEMLLLSKKVSNLDDGRAQIQAVLRNGLALEKFIQVGEAQGANMRIVDDYSLLPMAPFKKPVLAPQAGFVNFVDTYALGTAIAFLGGGRSKAEDSIDPGVGIEMCTRLGSYVEKNQPLCFVRSSGKNEEQAIRQITKAFIVNAEEISVSNLLGPRITSQNLNEAFRVWTT
jgi:pyrimidine-nucleoside phosphorylase